jgi:hypothetical protein
MLICSAFLTVLERLQEMKYAGICGDMQRVGHFWRKVAEMKGSGWNARALRKRPGLAVLLSGSIPKSLLAGNRLTTRFRLPGEDTSQARKAIMRPRIY